MRFLITLVLSVFIAGCATVQIDSSISKFRAEASKVKLGDKKEDVLTILMHTQKDLPSSSAKSTESFMKEKDVVEVYYFRSGRQPDGLTTDDEFTPYIFTNGILTGIGWTVLGGAKSHGQVIQPAPVTNIEQKQTTNIY